MGLTGILGGFPDNVFLGGCLSVETYIWGSSALRLESVIRVGCVICFHVYTVQEGDR